MSRLTDQLRNPVVQLLTAVVVGFTAGMASYRTILEVAHLDCVSEDSYVLKQDMAGRLIGVEALAEIDHLVELGEKLGGNLDDSQIWLLRTLTFIHEINLEQDATLDGVRMSSVEKDIRWAMTDPSVASQVQKTLGILQGLRAAFRARVPTAQRRP